jgi:vitamin B12/bleomycin/antimicrobial peptide transport system ATP-binding/permease protein
MDSRVEPRRARAPADHKPPPHDGSSLPAGNGVIAQLRPLFSALAISPHRRRLGLLAAGMFVVICANSIGQIRLNAWQGSFFDALEQRDLSTFGAQLLVFTVIVSGLLVLVVAQTWLREMLQVRLREWLTHDLLDRWLAPKRAYLLAQAGEIGVNPDQRVHEDTRHLTSLSTDLAVGLLQGSLLLISFIGVLWVLSSQVVFVVGDRSFSVPGYMVWCALVYAFVGSWFAWRVGRPLIPLNATRYAREAELRFALVRVSECAEGIALHGGEPDERRILDGTVSSVVTIMQGLAGRLARLTWVTSGHGWLGIVTPILVAAPGYFGGGLSFGGLMMVIGAFNQVQQSLRWFVEHFHQIADWRATLLRVMALREALLATDNSGDEPGGIRLVDHGAGQLGFENLSIAIGGGRATLDHARIEITAGERVLIVGETASEKSKLFRAMAGLWPWGSGAIHLPPRHSMMFMPQRPYLPLGSLQAAVSYPAEPERFDGAAVGRALQRVGLDHLVPLLDREERWDKDLSLDEQQRLAFARLLLHEPRWILLEDATGALEEDHRRLVMSIFEQELAHAAVISVSRSAEKSFYTRVLEFRRWPDGVVPVRLHPRPRPARAPDPAAAEPIRALA